MAVTEPAASAAPAIAPSTAPSATSAAAPAPASAPVITPPGGFQIPRTAAELTGAGRRAAKPYRGLPTPTLLIGEEYVADATAQIRRAQRRVILTTLTIADEQRTSELIEALVGAAERGVDVRVAADVFTYLDAGGVFLPFDYKSPAKRRSSALARRLTDAGADFEWLGREKGLPWRGRTHTKFCVVDDTAYSFGGVNLDDKGVSNVDYMLRVDDALLSDQLQSVFERIGAMNRHERGHRSMDLKHGKDHVLVDGGIPGDSIIYRRALKWARKADSVLLMSQYCPTGELRRVIRQRPHELWFNRPANASLANSILIGASMLVTNTQTKYLSRRYLHAKAIVFYLPKGKRVAITGSHNFVHGGVSLGTREIALQTKNPETIDQIEDFFFTHVRS